MAEEIIVEVTVTSAKDGSLLTEKFPMDKGMYKAIQSLPNKEDRVKFFTMEYRDWKKENNRATKHYGGSLDSEDELLKRAHDIPDDSLTPAEFCLKKERYELLNKALDNLRSRQKKIIVAIFYEGKSQADLAEELGMTESAMSHYVAFVLAKLRGELEGKI